MLNFIVWIGVSPNGHHTPQLICLDCLGIEKSCCTLNFLSNTHIIDQSTDSINGYLYFIVFQQTEFVWWNDAGSRH